MQARPQLLLVDHAVHLHLKLVHDSPGQTGEFPRQLPIAAPQQQPAAARGESTHGMVEVQLKAITCGRHHGSEVLRSRSAHVAHCRHDASRLMVFDHQRHPVFAPTKHHRSQTGVATLHRLPPLLQHQQGCICAVGSREGGWTEHRHLPRPANARFAQGPEEPLRVQAAVLRLAQHGRDAAAPGVASESASARLRPARSAEDEDQGRRSPRVASMRLRAKCGRPQPR
mmetsp:Transcript_97604/g.276123  ORF Transcript_97604/g.276123 Transcript_97604/m.276123 type:complete len:227 (-) Transcript_97604:119-799(-)